MRDVRGFKTLCEAETLMTQTSSPDRSDPGLDPGSARPAGASCPASPSPVPPALNRLMTPQYWLTIPAASGRRSRGSRYRRRRA